MGLQPLMDWRIERRQPIQECWRAAHTAACPRAAGNVAARPFGGGGVWHAPFSRALKLASDWRRAIISDYARGAGHLTKRSPVPVIDLFAGPGGLGEGFTAFSHDGYSPFRIGLSIEKSEAAHQTLRLRSFFRQFRDVPPDAYYEAIRRHTEPLHARLEWLFSKYPVEAGLADSDAWHAELGAEPRANVRRRIDAAIGSSSTWVLLGGPPCQAYSIAGRSRNKGNPTYKAEDDKRQFLYVEYLHVIAEHQPAVFVMENVKGLLSATVKESHILERILGDLKAPVSAIRREGRSLSIRKGRNEAPRYEVFSVAVPGKSDGDPEDFVVEMERFGIPQARHRLILLGVRSDVLGSTRPNGLEEEPPVPVELVLQGLPCLRSGLSGQEDSDAAWVQQLRAARNTRWFSASASKAGNGTYDLMAKTLDTLAPPRLGRGSEFLLCAPSTRYAASWYLDSRLRGVCNHRTRDHMVEDLYRYLYCASYGHVHQKSPVLKRFPRDLLPRHGNVEASVRGGTFDDRFRVQIAGRPATTVTSHIAKDGHYYIHPDPSQCRSLTVREAARLQTFPDNYFFCGSRTAQYAQVGNAVPPLLALGISRIVFALLRETGAIS